VNLVFDSVKWYSKATGQIWFHQPDPLGVSNGCIEVRDTADNLAIYCIDRSGPAGDTLPPVIIQDPIASPRTMARARVTELRPNDRGIKQIAASSVVNFSNQQIAWLTQRQATISFDIIDSLTPARAFVSASDTAGNVASDTIRYDPLPDITAPACIVETVDVSTRKFRVTDLAPWDRGIRDIVIVGAATNLSSSPIIFTNRFQAEQTFTLIDKALAGTVALRATDSAGHECLTTIDIEPSEKTPTPLLPFETLANLDFGKVLAPADVTLPLMVRNPNDRAVVVTQLDLIGDIELSAPNSTTPILFAPLETKSLNIRYLPSLLDIHGALLTLANDTMQLSRTTITGQSIGKVQLYLDSVSVDDPGQSGTLHLSIEAIPDPINLDTIKFTVAYNSDVAILAPRMPDCAGGNPLCDYIITYAGDPQLGSIAVELIRSNRGINQSLSRNTARIDIPFETFLAKDSLTPVSATDLYVSQASLIESESGVIRVGADGCGNGLIRTFLGREKAFTIEHVSPNPTATRATMIVQAARSIVARMAIYDSKGIHVREQQIPLLSGSNTVIIDSDGLAAGYYTVALSTEDGFAIASLIIRR
jgi:hypothetical protein